MAFYATMLKTVDRLLKQFGVKAILTKPSVSVNLATGVSTTNAQTANVYTVLESFTSKRKSSFGDYGFDGNSDIQSGDKLAHISGSCPLAPAAGDTLTVGGNVWNVVGVQTSEPAGVVLEYFCQIRR